MIDDWSSGISCRPRLVAHGLNIDAAGFPQRLEQTLEILDNA
jgi:hypothetical protein